MDQKGRPQEVPSPVHASLLPALQSLGTSDLGDIVVGKQALLASQSTRPPAGRIFFNNINNVIGIEAEFVCVLSVIGVQSLALWHLRLGLRLGFRSAPCWRRPAGCLSSDSSSTLVWDFEEIQALWSL